MNPFEVRRILDYKSVTENPIKGCESQNANKQISTHPNYMVRWIFDETLTLLTRNVLQVSGQGDYQGGWHWKEWSAG